MILISPLLGEEGSSEVRYPVYKAHSLCYIHCTNHTAPMQAHSRMARNPLLTALQSGDRAQTPLPIRGAGYHYPAPASEACWLDPLPQRSALRSDPSPDT